MCLQLSRISYTASNKPRSRWVNNNNPRHRLALPTQHTWQQEINYSSPRRLAQVLKPTAKIKQFNCFHGRCTQWQTWSWCPGPTHWFRCIPGVSFLIYPLQYARRLHECPVAAWMPGGSMNARWLKGSMVQRDGSKVGRSRHSLNFYVELDNKTIYGLKDNHGWSCGRHPMKEFQMSWSRAFTCLFTPLAGSRYQPTAPFPCTSLYGQNEANNSNHCILVHDWYYVKLITFKEAHLWWLTIS